MEPVKKQIDCYQRCFEWALSSSTPTLTHPAPLIPTTSTHPKYFPKHLHPPTKIENNAPPTPNIAPPQLKLMCYSRKNPNGGLRISFEDIWIYSYTFLKTTLPGISHFLLYPWKFQTNQSSIPGYSTKLC